MKKLVIFCFFLFSLDSVKAQNIGNLLLASDDASLLSQKYLNPAIDGMLSGINSGWYTTAKTHKKFGFDLIIGMSASFTPDKDQTFDFKQSQYNYTSLEGGNSQLPTVLSEIENETTFQVSIPTAGGNFKVGTFTMPGGVVSEMPVNATPVPHLQVGLGLHFKTDIKFRYVPTINYDSKVNGSLIGIGLQHDITQYLGHLSKLPFSVSILGAYSKANVDYNIDNNNLSSGISSTNGDAIFTLNTFTVQALGSLDFKIFTFYTGVGYNSATANFNLKGDYSLLYDVEDSNGNSLTTVTENISNPINLDFNSNGMRVTFGTRLNLSIFKIFADYTVQEYNTASAGIAFSLR